MISSAYPKITEYLEALQRSRDCLQIPDLSKSSILPGLMGRPKYYNGTFAIVVPLRLATTTKAVRLFTQHVKDAEAYYKTIHDYLHATRLPYFVDFAYHPQGMTVSGKTYPVVVMDWLEGQTLKAFVKTHLHDPVALLRVADAWRQMLLQLEQAKIAHGDLQEANVLVQPFGFGFQLRLLDYDSLVIPALEGKPETIHGSSAYQHPLRRTLRTKSLSIDTFPAFVIDLSLRIFAEAPHLWDEWSLEKTEGLLLGGDDYGLAEASPKFRYLSSFRPSLSADIQKLLRLCRAKVFTSLPSLSFLWSPLPLYPPLPPWCSPLLAAFSHPPRKAGELLESPTFKGSLLVWCPPGTFRMGSDHSDKEAFDDEKPQRTLSLLKGFWMKQTLVTRAEWRSLLNTCPSSFFDAPSQAPVEGVSWFDAIWFCNLLSLKEGFPEAYRLSGVTGIPGQKDFSIGAVEMIPNAGYRLPTEAEWEYAARAGSTLSRYGDLTKIAWYGETSEESIHPVGKKPPNAWGLHDVLGLLWEWCFDPWQLYSENEHDYAEWLSWSSSRVARGGSWGSSPRFLRFSSRSRHPPSSRSPLLGFRFLRTDL